MNSDDPYWGFPLKLSPVYLSADYCMAFERHNGMHRIEATLGNRLYLKKAGILAVLHPKVWSQTLQ